MYQENCNTSLFSSALRLKLKHCFSSLVIHYLKSLWRIIFNLRGDTLSTPEKLNGVKICLENSDHVTMFS